ncbi:hypothetical protein DOTSEDRAFT_178297 [Dothistroma septosporum NZE10]|uniref:Elongator complex protein 4 n=1 Tax=Dothistroma septosporum (strain NZE10 / CBS 128990) TaxID=675120 RepID=N1PEC8_DOTSN|nr:hypothetical protein DOTSEDRAFT_178297 [Dothistroma septosporum NZE10]
MAFRKRNVAIGRATAQSNSDVPVDRNPPGVRPSPLTSHPVTSTGAPSLDGLLGGHAGLALGYSLLIEENGTTDFAGVLLKSYAAEGICQGQVLHVVGMGDAWVRDLPGIAEEKHRDKASRPAADEEKMKIAWRYERLGQAGERGALCTTSPTELPFTHTFDLTKKITIPQDAKIDHIPIAPTSSPFDRILQSLTQALATTSPSTIHRLVLPSLLSPALYPPTSTTPSNLLSFLRSLKSLLRQHSTRLTALITLPLELHPRSSGLVRWAEILSDGVIELTPFPHLMDAANDLAQSSGARGVEEQPQGMVKVHKLPIITERGEGGAGVRNSMGEDLAFTVSRRKFVIKPFSLPPVEGDVEAQQDGGKVTARDVEF